MRNEWENEQNFDWAIVNSYVNVYQRVYHVTPCIALFIASAEVLGLGYWGRGNGPFLRVVVWLKNAQPLSLSSTTFLRPFAMIY